MNANKFLIPFAAGLIFGLSACSESATDAGDVGPGFLPAGSSAVVPMSSAGVPASSASIPGVTVQLAPAANAAVPATWYPSWLGYHYVTMETESTYYVDFANNFHYIFANYSPAARIIWSTQASNPQCKTDISGPMKSRACTVSEGIGYGMLIAFFQGDYDAFNRLWNYSRGFRAYNNQNLTPWITRSFTFDEIDLSSATDADLDIATALILMNFKTGIPDYLNDALNIIKSIWDEEVEQPSMMLMSGNTSMWNGKNGKPITYNLSYFSPVALRLFAMVDQSHAWNSVIEAMYTYMTNMQASGTGVFPDWSLATMTSVNPPNQAAGNDKTGYTYYSFNKESVRIPWRIAWDYYWFQEPRALNILAVLNNFIVAKSGGNPSSPALAVNYSWKLSEGADISKNTTTPSQWLAAWCATGIGTNPTWLDACTKAVNGTSMSLNASSYFSDILLMLYGQLLNGAFVRPF